MMANKTYKQPDEHGYYGKFGGAYIPEMLHRNVEELKARYLEIMYEASFQKEFQQLLQIMLADQHLCFCGAIK
jgi:tryptophan synthase beta chain